ncbi:MAG: gamma-glutamyltransferase family protein [Actinobacteria bacterium]|nr:gamma-glutamyltransferase family protein [Actinomycetota bacterium]
MPRMAIAGPSAVVTGAGARVAEGGGSVVDVAVVAGLTAMCTEPGLCAPAGGGYLTIDVPGSRPLVIDCYMAYPGLGFDGEPVLREVSMDYGGMMTTLVGAGSVAVPGAFAGLETAAAMFGVVPWRELLEVVAGTVEDGFPMSETARLYLTFAGEPIFSQDAATRAALYSGNRLVGAGETVHFAGLADTLRLIGEEGAEVFYRGELGQAVVSDLVGRGGQLTMEDLASYRVELRNPIGVEVGGFAVATNPPPAVGGVTVALALRGLAGHSPSVLVLTESLIAALRARFDDLAADREVWAAEALARAGLRSPSTIAVSVVGEDGAAVALSMSAGYGAGVIPRGTGMLMNNSVGEVELTPGEPPEPGERMMSNMAPSVGRGDRGLFAVGSPGADRITSAVVSAVAWIAAGEDLETAIEHPRAHPEFGEWGVRVAAEPGLDLEGLEWPVRQFEEKFMYFGGVNGAALLEGGLQAHADSRRAGHAVVTG